MCSKQRSGRGNLDPASTWDSRQSPISPKVSQLKVPHQPAALGLAFSGPEKSPSRSRQVIEMNHSFGLQVVVTGVDINSDVLVLHRAFLAQGSEAPGSRYQRSCLCYLHHDMDGQESFK